jgi:hypothetical protein
MLQRMIVLSLCRLITLPAFAIADGLVSPASVCWNHNPHLDPHLELLCTKSSSIFTPETWSNYTVVYQRFVDDVYDGKISENGMLLSAKSSANGVFESSRYVMFAHFSELQTVNKQVFVVEMIRDLAIKFRASDSVLEW